jgi:uncharacterized protein
MKIKLHEIQAIPDGLEVSFDHDLAWLRENLGEEIAEDAPDGHVRAEASLQMNLNTEEIIVRGKSQARLWQPCCRCVEATKAEIGFSFDLLFVPRREAPKPKEGEEIQLAEDDLDVDFYDGEEVDLSEVLREQLLLSLPPYPLCREDCKGLCARCGKNWNEGPCACPKEEWVDPRFAKLATLKLPTGNRGGDS